MKLEHVNLTVTDLERSIAFYSTLFQVGVRWRGTTGSGTPAVHLGTDEYYIALFEGKPKTVPVAYETAGFNHFGVIVDDLDAALERVKDLEAPHEVPEAYDPGRRVYCFDPDGHEIELVEYATSS